MRYLKNLILKGLAYLNGFSLMFFVCAIDNDSWIPPVMIAVNLAYLTLFAYANKVFDFQQYRGYRYGDEIRNLRRSDDYEDDMY